MSVKIKRIYDEPSPGDGIRILVDRLWPRGVSKDRAKLDDWARELAPSTMLRKKFHQTKDFAEFEQAYRRELQAKKEQLAALAEKARETTVTLLYSVANKTSNHALILAKMVESV